MFRCPYCFKCTDYKGHPLKSWKSVRSHTNKCKMNDKSFMICEYYGPISYTELNKYESIQCFKRDYPNLSFTDSHWCNIRRSKQSNIGTHFKKWDKDSIIKAIKKFSNINNRTPTTIDFTNNPIYPSYNTVVDYFGYWNVALTTAGLKLNDKTNVGIKTKAKDGITYRSKVEALFVDKFLFEKEEYEYEKPYGNGWLFDFYLPKYNLYIEIDGCFSDEISNYRTKMNKKIQYCNTNKLDLIVIKYTELYKDNFDFDFLVKSKLNRL